MCIFNRMNMMQRINAPQFTHIPQGSITWTSWPRFHRIKCGRQMGQGQHVQYIDKINMTNWLTGFTKYKAGSVRPAWKLIWNLIYTYYWNRHASWNENWAMTGRRKWLSPLFNHFKHFNYLTCFIRITNQSGINNNTNTRIYVYCILQKYPHYVSFVCSFVLSVRCVLTGYPRGMMSSWKMVKVCKMINKTNHFKGIS